MRIDRGTGHRLDAQERRDHRLVATRAQRGGRALAFRLLAA
ncbi:MAG: hypothetical protein M5U33_09570 [Pseudorhodoplanes sp.]|nr:hypothetical protein [Pseudorhodoplanes sp.]